MVHQLAVAAGAYPSPLRYGSPPFPKSVCTSVNEVICHGIPDGRPLEDGDIINVDVTVWLDGYHGDTSRCAPLCLAHYLSDGGPTRLVQTDVAPLHGLVVRARPGRHGCPAFVALHVQSRGGSTLADSSAVITLCFPIPWCISMLADVRCRPLTRYVCSTFLVGEVSAAARDLVTATKAAMEAGIQVCRPGVNFQAVGAAIEKEARAHGYTVNKDFIGHGVGKHFHSQPWVFPFRNREKVGVMQENQTFTVEPILHMGNSRYKMWKDKWTAVSCDRTLSAQFEHTVLVTADGVERLTAYE